MRKKELAAEVIARLKKEYPDLRLHLVYGSSVKGEETIKKTMAENEKIERGMKYGAGT